MRARLAALGLLIVSCGAGAPTYAGCADDLDCAEATDTCYRLIFSRTDGTAADGNLCTHECASDADCAPDGVCLSLAGDPLMRQFCTRRCASSPECFADFVCTRVESMDLDLCLP